MTTTIEVMKQALEALENYRAFFSIMQDGPDDSDVAHATNYLVKASAGATERITALRAEIERLESVEPVAGVHDESGQVSPWLKHWNGDPYYKAWKPLYTHPAPATPEGWQLVPKEPTAQMVEAGYSFVSDGGIGYPEDIYPAMLQAAPKPEEV